MKQAKLLNLVIIIAGISVAYPLYGRLGSEVPYDLRQIEYKTNLIPVAVVGGGPGGLSAAFNAARERFHTVLFQGPKGGGQMMDTNYVENWPGITRDLGSDIMKRVEKQAVDAGAIVVPETIVDIDCSTWPFKLTTDSGTIVYALSVIIASGAQPRKLGVPGEKEYYGNGVASCTLCDAPFTRDADVVIVGGGDSSVEFGINVAPYAKSITLLTKNEKLHISSRIKERLAKYPDIKILFDTKIQEIKGDGKHVNEIDVINLKTQKTETLPTQWVFLSIGQEPNTQMLNGQLPVDKEGCIVLPSKTQETNIKGVFAAGRVSDSPYKTGIIASGEGLKAALDALAFLENIGFEELMEEQLKHNLYHYNQKEESLKHAVKEAETEHQLKKLINASTNPVLLEFYSPTCPHCRAMERVVSAVAQKVGDSIEIIRADVNKFSKVANKFKIKSIPTFIMLKNGKESNRTNGEMSEAELQRFIKNSI